MPPQSHSPSIARCLLVATLLTLGFLAAVSLSDIYTSDSLQKHGSQPEDDPSAPVLEKRLLGLGGVVGLVPSLLGNIVPGGIVSSLVAQVTADVNSLLPMLADPSAQSPNGVPLLNGAQATAPLTVQPVQTAAQLGGLADKLGGLLNGIVPVAAPSIIAAITEQALGVVASVEALATDVASLGDKVGSGQMQGSDALGQIGGLLGSLDSKVNDIVNDVTSNIASDISLPVLQDLSQAVSSGLGDIVGAANGPLSLVGDLIEHNICGVVTAVDGIVATVAGICGDMPSAIAQVSSEVASASITNTDAILTGDASASTMVPSSPAITGAPTTTAASTSLPQSPQGQGTLTNPTTSSTGASGSNPSGNGAASPPSSQQSSSNASSGSSRSGTQTAPGQSSAGSSASGSNSVISPTAMGPLPSTGGSAPGTTSAQPPTTGAASPSMAGSAQPGAAGTSQATATGGMASY
ncbi:hypothetical protein GGR55DRAFT_143850 [Xylaria sp. FL0064]|nr:hypothetical protein GGR55DRAFT_143850 [Xylaria sp. FL0064]